MHINHHSDHSLLKFIKRTISAQLHLVGCLLAIAGLIVLLYWTKTHPGFEHVLGCLVFGLTSILVFGASATYHFLDDGYILSPKLQRILNQIDHFSIYLFIAGTYTPFLINAIEHPWKIILLITIWSIAIIGILYTNFKNRLPKWAQHRFLYTGIFILMGWTIVIRLNEMINRLSSYSILMLVAGGLSYTIGATIYALKRPNIVPGIFGYHELWHVAVILGFGFHYFMILNFYIV